MINETDKDRLLDAMERIRQELLNRAQRERVRLDGNMLKKLSAFYHRHRYDREPLSLLLSLLSTNPGKRGKQFDSNWSLFRNFFREKQPTLNRYSPDELSYILGWLSRQDWGERRQTGSP